MRARLILAALGVFVVALVWWVWPADQTAPPPSRATAEAPPPASTKPQAAGPLPIPHTPCVVRGVVHGGTAQKVSLHSVQGQIDLPARITGQGEAFEGELPEQGPLEVLVVATDGRTASADARCDGSGQVVVQVFLPKQDTVATSVSGRCFYLETGVPVAEARVRGRWAEGDSRVVFAALTDDEGGFALPAPAGVFEVSCGKDGDETAPVRVTLEPGVEKHLELYLGARAAVTGTVRDADGVVAGISVQGRAAQDGARPQRRTAETDAEGRYLLMGLPPGPVVVEVQDNGRFAEGHGVAKVDLPYAEIDLLLEPSQVILQGNIKSEGGVVSGAQVEVYAISARRGVGPRAAIRRSVISDPEGHYAVGGLTAGMYRAEASAPGRAPAQANVNLPVGTTRLDLTLLEACETQVQVLPETPSLPVWVRVQRKGFAAMRVAGRTGEPIIIEGAAGEASLSVSSAGAQVATATAAVRLCEGPLQLNLQAAEDSGALDVTTIQADGTPVAGVRVWINAPGGVAVTGEGGQASFEGLKARMYRLGTRDTESVEAEVFEGQRTRVELKVPRSDGEISGVVQAGGSPVEGAAIYAACADSGRPPDLDEATVRARSSGSGEFSFVPEDGGVCLVRAEHGSRGASQPVLLRAGDDPARIELLGPAQISGRVVHAADGQPVTQYTLSVRTNGRIGSVEARTLQISDPDGRFEVHELSPGPTGLSVSGAAGRAHLELDLGPGEHKDGVEISIFSQGKVVGRVVSERGQAIVGAQVRIESQDRPLGRTVTNQEGRFSFSVPAGDPLRVYASANGYYPLGTEPFDLAAGPATDIGAIELPSRGGPEEKEGGIGIMFSGESNGIRVIRFTADSPAREAGLLEGDLITAIDGVPFARNPLVNWVVTLRGLAGTPVVLEVQRGARPPFVRTVIRRAIGLDAVPQRAP